MLYQAMKHPATLLGLDDIRALKRRVEQCKLSKTGPACTQRGISKLCWDTVKGYKHHAVPRVHCMWGQPAQGHKELCEQDAVQVYLQTLSFLVSDDTSYAKTALDIIIGWCKTCKEISGDNRVLEAAWSTACFARCMELLKFTCPHEYSKSGVDAIYRAWVNDVVMPALTSPIAWTINSGETASNWHAARTEALMQLAVWRDDETAFDAQVAEFRRILPIIIKPNGFGNEVLRDLMHAQFSIGSLAHICEIASKARPGLDLFMEADARLARGMEYVATLISGDRSAKEVCGKELKKVDWVPAGAWGLAVTAYEKRGIPVPMSRKVLNANSNREYPWLCWGSTNLTHRVQ
jgi:hypothetical protein